ncbi:hypothetical protein [Candidatus Clostridium radicumherbarum]|uniref:DUF1444 domain-containing protein n=1 Tax=Candidatus Clostridium radicumherbarum TaxID=3381662 RepID=A0ABW8TY99_9CLOT
MKLILEKFKKKIFWDIKKRYPDSYIIKELMIIDNGSQEFTVGLNEVYKDYLDDNGYRISLNKLLKLITNHFIENRESVNYNYIYPIIKSKEFSEDCPIELVKRKLALDLEIILAEDKIKMFEFCRKENNIDESRAFKAALANINNLNNELCQLHDDCKIFSAKFNNDCCSSLLFNFDFRQQIMNKVGNKFLLAIPSTTGILIGSNEKQNIMIMKKLIESDDDMNRVSSHVYRVSGNEWEYAD